MHADDSRRVAPITGAASLLQQLRQACAPEWQAYVRHRFVAALADGSLPEASFRYYLVQDYLFLMHLARAYGLAAFKAQALPDIRAAAAGLTAIVDREMQLHLDYCRAWKLGTDDVAAAAEDPATVAYTRYMLERGLAGDLLDLQVAISPCIVGYAEIGSNIENEAPHALAGNPYRAWIETYAAADFQQFATEHTDQLDSLYARLGGSARLPALAAIFRTATRLEAAFWEMGLAHAGE
jgi:thiaminase/transcriptional activator TenA